MKIQAVSSAGRNPEISLEDRKKVLVLEQTLVSEHENYCGSRTEQCPECNDYVMLKDWEKHQSMRLYHGKTIRPFIMRS